MNHLTHSHALLRFDVSTLRLGSPGLATSFCIDAALENMASPSVALGLLVSTVSILATCRACPSEGILSILVAGGGFAFAIMCFEL